MLPEISEKIACRDKKTITVQDYPLKISPIILFQGRLITEQGYSVQQAADSLGIRSNILYRWKQQQEQQSSKERLLEDEHAELNRLRKEIKHLRMKKEILKKASAFFAQEMK
ncbi:transposase [Nitrosomonas sp.]|uniref:transposase n=1 Tax=Nitrosomonas sp. TaxID=42353 RepID=UPI00208D5143|nr:transposase [Nitrosomonas sp.]GJL75245.1 MAG: hypothetical protein NMNS02_13510 [Nitrosomonas sp.]